MSKGSVMLYGGGNYTVENIVPTMTSNTTSYGECSQYVRYSFDAYKLFYLNVADFTGGRTGGWLQYYAIEKYIPLVGLYYTDTQGTGGGNCPKDMYFSASNDGENFDVLSTWTNMNEIGIKSYLINASKKYCYFRIGWTSCYGNSGYNAVFCSSVQFYGRK